MSQRHEVPELLAHTRRVLVVGEPPHGHLAVLTLDPRTAMRCQVFPRFDGALLGASAVVSLDHAERLLLFHNVAAHLEPGGVFVVTDIVDDLQAVVAELLERCGFDAVELGGRAVARRTDRTTIHDLVAHARARLRRLTPDELDETMRSPNPPVVLDTRTPTDREHSGVIPGSVHAPRTVLEWLVDPASGYSHPSIASFDQPIVVVCNEGYSSSLAAAGLHDLGFTSATDLIGGVLAWKVAGYPVVPPGDHHVEPIIDR